MMINTVSRRRPAPSEHFPGLLLALCDRFETIEGFWAAEKHGGVPELEGADDIAPTAVLNQLSVTGISGQIFFAGRFEKSFQRDVGNADAAIGIDTDRVDLASSAVTFSPFGGRFWRLPGTHRDRCGAVPN